MLRATIFVLLTLWASPVMASEEVSYLTPNFRFSLQVSHPMKLCRELPQAPNDGVTILLNSADCSATNSVSRVAIGGEWILDPAVTDARAYAASQCGTSDLIRLKNKFGGLRVWGCKLKGDEGFSEFRYYAVRNLNNEKTVIGYLIDVNCKSGDKSCLSETSRIVDRVRLD